MTTLLPRRPYLLRALYEWLIDNKMTPHLAVDINVHGVIVPLDFARNGKIILNIAPHVAVNLAIGNEKLQFKSRFGGVLYQVVVPIAAVLAIYARENGAGIIFEVEPAYDNMIIKEESSIEDIKNTATKTVISLIKTTRKISADVTNPENEPTPPLNGGGRPPLHIVK